MIFSSSLLSSSPFFFFFFFPRHHNVQFDIHATVRGLEGLPKPSCFEIATYGPSGGTKVYSATSAEDRANWINSIKAALIFARTASSKGSGAARRASLTLMEDVTTP
jgi:hypothetical protein